MNLIAIRAIITFENISNQSVRRIECEKSLYETSMILEE